MVSGRAVELHAARPEDLTPLAAVYARAGNLIVRAEFKPGQEASLWRTATGCATW
jgi:inner membrane protein